MSDPLGSESFEDLTQAWQSATPESGASETTSRSALESIEADLRRRSLLEGLRFWGVLVLELVISVLALVYGLLRVGQGAVAEGGVLVVLMLATIVVIFQSDR